MFPLVVGVGEGGPGEERGGWGEWQDCPGELNNFENVGVFGTDSEDPDQTAVRLGSTLFAVPSAYFQHITVHGKSILFKF